MRKPSFHRAPTRRPLASQRRQAHARRVEPAVGCNDLPGHIACPVACEKTNDVRDFALGAIAVEGDRVVIGRAYIRRVDGQREFRVHRSGADAVRADPDFAKLRRLLFGQMDHCRFGCAIGDPQRRGAQAGDRGDVYDGPTPGGEERKAGLGHQKHAVEVGFHHAAPAGKISLGQGAEIGDARVVDQNVEAPEGLLYLRDSLRDLLRDRNVASDGERAGEGGRGFHQFFRIAVEHDDAAAFGVEKRGGGKADAAGGTGDQGNGIVHFSTSGRKRERAGTAATMARPMTLIARNGKAARAICSKG